MDPAIYGNKVVYEDDTAGGRNIFMYDISTKKETRLTSSGVYTRRNKSRYIWKQGSVDGLARNKINPNDPDLHYNIYVSDISTKKTTLIPTGGVHKILPFMVTK